MQNFIWAPPLLAFLITLLATPLTIKIANRFNLVDDPKKRPHPAHIHKSVIPRAGGLPVFLGIVISILIFIPFDKHIFGIILAGLVLLVMGILDDLLQDFSPLHRLLLQFLAALIVVFSGVGISFVTNPFGGILRLDSLVIPIEFFGTHTIVVIADIFALLWIVWMMNMVNWSKGVDGQMPGIVTAAGLTIAILSYRLFMQGDSNQLYISLMALITAASAFGFLFFNWHPAKIFPGFSGSNILAFMIAVLSILSGAKLATALLVLLIPSVDFFYTFFRRILSKKSPFLGDQKHLHHLLLKKGWSHARISLFYMISAFFLGLLSTTLSSEGKLFVVIGVGILTFGGILWLHLLLNASQKKTPQENIDKMS